MFENLSERLESAFKQIKGEGRITELNIAATVKDIRRALIDADVNFKIAKEFTDTIRETALGQKVLTAVSPGQLMVKIVKDELVSLMGGTESEFNAKGAPAVIALNAVREARSKNKNVVIIDTAGRLAIDEAMMAEVEAIKKAVSPGEILFVVDSMTGQDAV